MPKKKRNYHFELFMVIVVLAFVELFTNLYWNDKVVGLIEQNKHIKQVYMEDTDSTAAIVVADLALQDKYENMRRYAWKLEKKIQKLEKTLEYEAEVKP